MYNKLFGKILDSSIWLEDPYTRIVWITLLAAMDQDGYAHFSAIANLAIRAQVPVDKAEIAVDKLMAPDAESGDPEHDGRRIERVPGGFIILNAPKYRDLATRIIQREQTRERVAKHRAKKDVTKCNDLVTQSYTEAEANTEAKRKRGKKNTPSPNSKNGKTLPKDWKLPNDWKVWTEANCPLVDPEGTAEDFRDWAHGNSNRAIAKKADWFATWRNWCRRDNEKYEEQAKWQKRK